MSKFKYNLYLQSLMGNKRWHIAKNFLDNLCIDKKNYILNWEWKSRHIDLMLKGEQQYISEHSSINSIKYRLKQIDLDYKLIDGQICTGGTVNFSCFVYKVMKNSSIEKIFEKIYFSRTQQVDLEVSLYKTLGNFYEILPIYKGCYRDGQFDFIYFEYIDGINPCTYDYIKKYYKDIISSLWNVEYSYISGAKKTLIDFKEIIHKIQKFVLPDISHKNYALLSDDYALYLDSAEFIMHSDLSKNNVLVTKNNSLKIIDFDKWHVNKVGTEFNIKYKDQHADTVDFIYNLYICQNRINFHQFFYNFILYNVDIYAEQDPSTAKDLLSLYFKFRPELLTA